MVIALKTFVFSFNLRKLFIFFFIYKEEKGQFIICPTVLIGYSFRADLRDRRPSGGPGCSPERSDLAPGRHSLDCSGFRYL